jgi:hypothetical protein
MRTLPILTLALLSGCATTVPQPARSLPAQAAAEAATIHILRKSGPWGAAIAAPVFVNGALIGRLGPGGHLQARVQPGKVSVSSTKRDLVIDAEPSSECYVQVSVPVQLWLITPSFNLTLIDKAAADAISK